MSNSSNCSLFYTEWYVGKVLNNYVFIMGKIWPVSEMA